MNDRFKFRAWNKEDKKMYAVEGVYAYEDEYTQGGEVFLQWHKTSHYFPEQVELMQCTGLKDKNGKLIYEGDVVIYKGNLKVVVFDEINLCHCLLWVKHYNPQWKSSVSGLKYDKVTKTKKLEVIGNIYENADLLEEQQNDN